MRNLLDRLKKLVLSRLNHENKKPFPITLTGEQWIDALSAIHLTSELTNDKKYLALLSEMEQQFFVNFELRNREPANRIVLVEKPTDN